MSTVAVVSREPVSGGTTVQKDADLSRFDIVAADPDHLSHVIRRTVRERLDIAVLVLSGDAGVDARRLRKPGPPTSTPTLSVCDTGMPARQYGFSMGFGALFHTADMRRAGGLRALRGALAKISATVVVDGEVLGEELALAGVSTTRDFPLRMRASAPPGAGEICFLWNNLDGAGFLSHALALARGRNLPLHRVGSATRVSFDIAGTGYSLDGALHAALAPRVVSVTRGPDVLVCA